MAPRSLIRNLALAAAFGTALAPLGAQAQNAPLDGAIDACIDFVNSSTLLEASASGSGSQGIAAGFHFIERTTAWDASRNYVECRLIGLRQSRPEVVFDWPTGAALVATWIDQAPGIARGMGEGDTVLGCGTADILARPFEGELRYNTYRPVAGATPPVEVIITRSGTFCGASQQ